MILIAIKGYISSHSVWRSDSEKKSIIQPNSHPLQITHPLGISKYLKVGRLLVHADLVDLLMKKAFKPSHQEWSFSHFHSQWATFAFIPAAASFFILLPTYPTEEDLCDLCFSCVTLGRAKAKIAVIKWKYICVYIHINNVFFLDTMYQAAVV